MLPSVIALSAVILPHVMITVYHFNMLLLLFTSRIMNDDVMIMHGVRKRSCPKRPNAPLLCNIHLSTTSATAVVSGPKKST